MPENPVTLTQKILRAGIDGDTPPEPVTLTQKLLVELIDAVSGGGGGGGGVPTVEASNDGVLNKTWQEIFDAGFCVLKYSGEMGISYNVLTSVDHDNDGYYVTFYSGEVWFTFIASTANDYPVISNE